MSYFGGGIHAKCLMVADIDGTRVICGKSKGHHESENPRHRGHYDPNHDVHWNDAPRRKAR